MTKKTFIIISCLLCLLLLWPTGRVSAVGDEFAGLAELSADAAQELHVKIGGVKVAIDRNLIKDSVTGETSNLSAYIKNELEAALSAKGFTLVDDIQDSVYFMTISYQKDRSVLKVFVKYRLSAGDMSYKSISRRISADHLPKEALGTTLDGKVARMAGKLHPKLQGLTVFVNPIVESSGKYSCDFSTYLTAKLKTQLATAGSIEIIDEKPQTAGAGGKRSLIRKQGDVQNLAVSDAVDAGANAFMEGVYLTDADKYLVSVTVKDNRGKLLAGVEEQIDKSLVTLSTENKAAQKIAVISDVQTEESGGAVKISTTRGSRYQVYYEKEKIRFDILVSRPLYVYAYNINSQGEVFLLHPGENEKHVVFQPGSTHTIPAQNDSWIEVEPPFGAEQVKVFAAERPIALPALSDAVQSRGFTGEGDMRKRTMKRHDAQKAIATQETINPYDLVDYFRGQASRQGLKLYEDSIFVETRPR